VLESPDADAVRNALRSRVDVVLVFGGDGTVNRHLAHLAKTNLPVMAIPAGSGNDLARASGTLTLAGTERAWQLFLSSAANVSAADLGVIDSGDLAEPRYFSCCANIGLDADAARRTDRMPDWLKSRGGYFIGGLLALARYKPEQITYSTDDHQAAERGWFLSVSNTPTFGGGLKIAPQASIHDGQLDVTFAPQKHFSRAALAAHFPKIFSGKHIGLGGLNIFKTTRMDISTPFPQPVYADGEYITETPCRIEVAPGALRLVTASVL
jgi:diacylglycerol kinase (ATP)